MAQLMATHASLHIYTVQRTTAVTQSESYSWQLFGLPSRVRTDYREENVGIWPEMEERRGPNGGSYLAVRSKIALHYLLLPRINQAVSKF